MRSVGADRVDPYLKYLNHADVAYLGISEDSVRKLALANLGSYLPEMGTTFDGDCWNVYGKWEFESSLDFALHLNMPTLYVLKPEVWSPRAFPVKGELLFSIPSWGILMVTDSADEKATAWLTRITADMYNGQKPVSPYLYRRNGEKLEKIDTKRYLTREEE